MNLVRLSFFSLALIVVGSLNACSDDNESAVESTRQTINEASQDAQMDMGETGTPTASDELGANPNMPHPKDEATPSVLSSDTMGRAEEAEQMNNTSNNTGGESDIQQDAGNQR
ncbi:hypothetical protein [Phytohalomonas tamaricis]|uniref:hypothetical protein n=1 Tax=Phytohalomonas tamaricis TaxID=2081032 RepID=UPI000D0B65D3|nr:hypothetical protein [Phytohalomonas tamaricis]